MDPVQNDLKLLGVKPLEPDDYNIHTPPLPRDGKIKPANFHIQIPGIFSAKGFNTGIFSL